MYRGFAPLCAVSLLCLAAVAPAFAEPVEVNGHVFDSWQDFAKSEYFLENGLRCGTVPDDSFVQQGFDAGDCAYGSTNPDPMYDPGTPFAVNVVFHLITNTSGTQGFVPDNLVYEQMDVINEDFQAIFGSNGQNGNDASIVFQLATVDPGGSPTTGITRHANTTWFNDGGSYYNSIAWDTNEYVNVYSNLASGSLGYVPNLPQGGIVGSNADRVVVLWSTVGADAPFGPPYHLGRTLTHELGHYFGLHHTFSGGCASVANCYNNGDRICDTNPEASPTGGCPGSRITCSLPAPFDNYMDYSDDICMEQFTVEQVRRMRCTVEFWRPDLQIGVVGVNEFASAPGARLLHANRPNPFGLGTEIRFDLPRSGEATLRIVDVTGRSVRTLASGYHRSGPHHATWDGLAESGAPAVAGVYFYRLETAAGTETRRMVKTR